MRLRTEIFQAEAEKVLGADASSTKTMDKLLWQLQQFLPNVPRPSKPAPKAPRRK